MKICKKDDSILNQGPDLARHCGKNQNHVRFSCFKRRPFGNQLLFLHVKKVIFAVFFSLKVRIFQCKMQLYLQDQAHLV